MQVADDEPLPAGMEDVRRTGMQSWEEALAHWRASLDALGEAFARGDAHVDPLRGVCDYCHLALLCRINEQREFAEDADGEE